MRLRRVAIGLLLLVSGCAAPHAADLRVRVKPVFLLPSGVQPPGAEYSTRLMRHLEWARARYRELLDGRDTFELAGRAPLVLASEQPAGYFTATSDGGAEVALIELFAHDHVDRFSCPFIYVVLFVGTGQWPGGGGRPINGGLNTGGGIVILAADGLIDSPNFQSTLQHELGHGFGLPHVDVYGHDMSENPSLMSYNPRHHTNGFTPSDAPGALIPEDRRALALNRRVFPGYEFVPSRHAPAQYSLAPIVLLGPMTLQGQEAYNGPEIVESPR
ncbi:MAG: hypothetical protein CHACPFDD_00607 [Phycisphaerae bacterium]|nr:hypothetical protein [Phycisphaerae bacterium]